MLTTEEFVKYLDARRTAGATLRELGLSLGVSKQAVFQWLTGPARPSATVLLLAARLQREMAGGWPL
jgi:transcriptional regulator with XRE-family HTH domain